MPNYQTDAELGQRVHGHLKMLSVETPADFLQFDPNGWSTDYHVGEFIKGFGLDMEDASLQDTPARIGKMYREELFYGLNYDNFPKCTTFPKIADEMVLERGITVHSMCEHHFVPFIGKASVAYIPNAATVGLSKLNRVVDFFCRRPQVQERLTAQIAYALELVLGTPDVAVVIKAEHLCVKLRGVQDSGSDTVTSMMRGKFLEVPALRSEFLSLSRS